MIKYLTKAIQGRITMSMFVLFSVKSRGPSNKLSIVSTFDEFVRRQE